MVDEIFGYIRTQIAPCFEQVLDERVISHRFFRSERPLVLHGFHRVARLMRPPHVLHELFFFLGAPLLKFILILLLDLLLKPFSVFAILPRVST